MKPEVEIGKLLIRDGLTLAIAESCTGGLITHRITNVPGSSKYFERGFVVYSNRSKVEVLGVNPKMIEEHGAVSDEVARAMARGAKKTSGAGVGLGVTGIAGPVSDESEKPVGLVYIAVCAPSDLIKSEKHTFQGTRLQVKKQSADAAFALLIKTMKS